ncbi:hypothetical protein RUND412_003874 [Rhizina undulata]
MSFTTLTLRTRSLLRPHRSIRLYTAKGSGEHQKMDSEERFDQRNKGNVIGGHKANLSNPHTSDEAKENSKKILQENFGGGETGGKHGTKNMGNVIGGYKATIHNPNVSDEAKERAEQRLEELGAWSVPRTNV